MASENPIGSDKRSRHRIREITLDPSTYPYDIKMEILIDGKTIHKLQKIEKRRSLHWDDLYLPCDVYHTSTVTIRVTEIHTIRSRDRVESHIYRGSEVVGKDSLAIDRGSGKFTVNARLFAGTEAERMYQESLAKAQHKKTHPGVVEKLGRVGVVFKGLLGLGSAVAEVDPTGNAKAAFVLCTKAWEHLEAQEKLEIELRQFIESLADMVPSIEDAKPLAEVNLAETVQKTIELVEDVSFFVLNYRSRNAFIRLISSALDSELQERMQTFSTRFKKLRSEFDTRVGVQILETVQAIKGVEAETLSSSIKLKLQPANLASYDSAPACMAGTRMSIIHDLMTWAQEPSPGQKLAWVYGLEGLGKSSIAASFCQKLDDSGKLGASFFCKRDSPELRDPCRLITTVAYRLAIRWQAYGGAMVKALQADSELHLRYIQPLYEGLLSKPLRSLLDVHRPQGDLVILVDALDECGDSTSRRQLLACVQDMSKIAPWLKVVITSRPNPDIQEYFGQGEKEWFKPYNVLGFDAFDDIETFVRAELSGMEKVKGWPTDGRTKVANMSNGLFIWARTARDDLEVAKSNRNNYPQVSPFVLQKL